MFKENSYNSYSSSSSYQTTNSSSSSNSSNTNYNEGCLSTLTKLFVKEAQYAQITKDEALNACSLVLITANEEKKKNLLFDSLLENQILVPSSRNIYLIHDISTQAILTNLTLCYSPLCSKSTLACYSPCCPKKKLRKDRLYLNDDLLNRTNSHSSTSSKEEDDWSSNIPRSILENLSPQEKKKQLAIEELQNYEANFLKQLIVIRDIFARPLLSSHTTIQESRRFSFHDTLFGNYHVLANHHKRILRDLEATRGEFNLYPNSTIIGDILYKHFSKMTDPYIRYVSNHVFAEYQYKLECNRNPAFVQFIEQQEAIERDFRLTLKGLLLSPIVRMAKYDLLLSTISNNTTLDQERQSLIATKSLLCDILHKINEATRNAEAEQRLMEIKFGLRIRRLSIKSQYRLSQILPDDATLIHEGTLELINRIPPTTCQVFLFSNALLITREKSAVENSVGIEFTLLDDKSIPLHMLRVGNPFSTAFSTNSSFSSNSSAQQANILSSIRYQLSSGSYHYYHARRWNSENSGSRMIKEAQQVQQAASSNKKEGDTISMHSDDGSSTYSEVIYTISGLKLRHRIRSIKQRIKRKNKTSISYSTTSSSSTSSSKTSSISPTSSLAIRQQQTYASRGIMRPRLLQIYHIADPTLTYLFECPSTDNRLIWKNRIKSVLPNPDHGPFGLQELVSTSNYSSLRSVNGRYATGCGTIWCSLPFTTLDGRDAIALGTQYGLWVAYSDGSELFKQILPNNSHQLELFDNRILIARIFKPNRILGAILIDHIYPPSSSANNSAAPSILTAPTIATVLAANTGATTNNSTEINIKEFQPLQKSGVISFAVGTLRGEPILVYLRRRRTGSVRLVLMFYRGSTDSTTANVQQQQQEQQPWFRKFKEYKPISIQPTDIKIIQDTVYIRSRTEGIEKVDILNWIMGASSSSSSVASSASNFKYSYRISLPHHISLMSNNPPQVVDDPSLTTIAYVPLNQPDTGLICSAEAAWPVAEANADLLQQEITFETEAKSVVISYPYLIIISSNVIEVRHLETTTLVQAIAGNKIRCVYVSRTDITTPIIHVTMLHAYQDQTKLYQLYLKEPPIAFDE